MTAHDFLIKVGSIAGTVGLGTLLFFLQSSECSAFHLRSQAF
jgi:hypothetical protein